MAERSSSSGGVGFVGLLTTAFVVLKLIHAIDWSWWWVTSPVWIAAGFWLAIIAGVGIWLGSEERRKKRIRLEWAEQRRKELLK